MRRGGTTCRHCRRPIRESWTWVHLHSDGVYCDASGMTKARP